jgi:hypothetical protein
MPLPLESSCDEYDGYSVTLSTSEVLHDRRYWYSVCRLRSAYTWFPRIVLGTVLVIRWPCTSLISGTGTSANLLSRWYSYCKVRSLDSCFSFVVLVDSLFYLSSVRLVLGTPLILAVLGTLSHFLTVSNSFLSLVGKYWWSTWLVGFLRRLLFFSPCIAPSTHTSLTLGLSLASPSGKFPNLVLPLLYYRGDLTTLRYFLEFS